MIATRRTIRLLCALLIIYSIPGNGLAQTWDGGGANDNWSTANNWNPNGVPANNGTASIVFAGSTRLTPFLDQNFSISSLSFPETNSQFTLGGSGTLTLGSGGLSVANLNTINHALSLGANQSWNLNDSLIVNGDISGTGRLTINSDFAFHQLLLTGARTYSGPAGSATIINSGQLSIGNGGTTGSISGNITNNSRLSFNRSDTYFFEDSVAGTGTTFINGGTLVSTGSIQTDVFVNNATFQLGNGGAPVSSGFISSNGTTIYNFSTGSLGFGGSFINGTGNLIKRGSGTLGFSVSQSYSGTTTIEEGILVSNNGLASPGGTLTVNSGASLQTSGVVQRPIAGAGLILATGTTLLGDFNSSSGFNFGGTLDVNSRTVQLLDSDVAQLGSITSITTGRLTSLNGIRLGPAAPAAVDITKILSAASISTIEGSFTNRGRVNGPTVTGQFLTFTGDVNGAGSYTGNIVFSDGFSPGDSPAIVNFHSLTLDNTASLTMEIGGTIPGIRHDQLVATSAVNVGGELIVDLIGGFTPLPGQQFLLLDNQTTRSINGTFAGLAEGSSFVSDGQLWRISYQGGTGNDLTLTAVPEPTTLILGTASIAGVVIFYWHRRRKQAAAMDDLVVCDGR